MTEPDEMVNVRYMVDDVDTAIEFYTEISGSRCAPAPFPPCGRHPRQPAAAAQRAGQLGRASHADGTRPSSGGWNRIHFIVADIAT